MVKCGVLFELRAEFLNTFYMSLCYEEVLWYEMVLANLEVWNSSSRKIGVF
jgi:hypothetical protein